MEERPISTEVQSDGEPLPKTSDTRGISQHPLSRSRLSPIQRRLSSGQLRLSPSSSRRLSPGQRWLNSQSGLNPSQRRLNPNQRRLNPSHAGLNPGQPGSLTEILEGYHMMNRITRILHHRPILFTFTASSSGVFVFPLLIFLLTICGSFGVGILIFIMIEGGLFLMAVMALVISLFVPVCISMVKASARDLAYQTKQKLRDLLWRYLGWPIRYYRSMNQKCIDLFFSIYRTLPETTIQTSRNPSSKSLMRNEGEFCPPSNPSSQPLVRNEGKLGPPLNPSSKSLLRIEEEVVDPPLDRQYSSVSNLMDEFEDILQYSVPEAALHEEVSEEFGVVEGAFLYMADGVHHFISLLFFMYFCNSIITVFTELIKFSVIYK